MEAGTGYPPSPPIPRLRDDALVARSCPPGVPGIEIYGEAMLAQPGCHAGDLVFLCQRLALPPQASQAVPR